MDEAVPIGEVVELLQGLIRNACVNDGTPSSGQEVRNADLLRAYLETPAADGFELRTFEPSPGRVSLVARLPGTDSGAPRLCLLCHSDVVPALPERWSRDPFGGELVDGEVWGRGAVDMLNLTASMAVAFRHFATAAANGRRLRGDLLYVAAADEEAGGELGMGWLCDNAWEEIAADYVLTEMGGVPIPSKGGERIWMVVGEKGVAWKRLRVHGTPGHGSLPLGADNALLKATEISRRLASYRPPAQIDDTWRQRVEGLDLPPETIAGLLDPEGTFETLSRLEDRELARQLHALSHTTFSPNVLHSGVKTNVIPADATLEVDIRVLPGETEESVERHLKSALGDLFAEVEIEPITGQPATRSTVETPLWEALQRHVGERYPGAELLPSLISAGTDARYYRLRGAVCYGAGLYAASLGLEEFWRRFHGDDERIDTHSLELTTGLWLDLVPDFLSG